MTKISPVRKGAVLAALGFTAALASGLAATPATAQPAPSTEGAGPALSVTTDAATLAHCGDHRGCVYGGANYTVYRAEVDAADAGPWIPLPGGIPSIHSAKNHFDNRKLQVGHLRADGTIKVVRCLNPNTQRPGPFPDGARLIRVGRLGSRCAS